MTIKATLALALPALVRNKARSLLTMLGIVIGVAAVIVTVAIGVGARTSVQQSINSLGSNLIVVQPGSVTQTGARGGFGTASTLTPDDGLALAKLPGVAAVSPIVTVRTQVVAGQNNWQTTIAGVAPTYTFIRSWPIDQAASSRKRRRRRRRRSRYSGQTVIAELFPNGDSPLGQTVIIKGVPFTVIGTLTPLGQSGMGQDQDDTVLIPYTSAMQRLTGLTTVNSLMISAASADGIDPVQTEVTQLLEQRHRIVHREQRRLSSAQPAVDRASRIADRHDHGTAARRRRRGLADRRRHRHHEHHARLGHRAHARDRPAHVGRRARRPRSCVSSWPSRSCSRRSAACIGVLVGGIGTLVVALARAVADGDPVAVGPGIGRLLGDRRHLLRLLSRAPGGAAQSDRGAALRVTHSHRRRRRRTAYSRFALASAGSSRFRGSLRRRRRRGVGTRARMVARSDRPRRDDAQDRAASSCFRRCGASPTRRS